MRKFLFRLILIIVIGILFFAVAYWMIGKSFNRSIELTLNGMISGLGALYLQEYFEIRKKKKQESK